MRNTCAVMIILGLLTAAGCESDGNSANDPTASAFGPAAFDPVASGLDEIASVDRRAAFAESNTEVSVLHVRAAPADYKGNPLYDGFELTVQPLDTDDNTVRKIGSLTVTAYAFNVKTKSGRGPELMRWFVPNARMMDAWQRIGLDEGYRLRLSWERRPRETYIVLEATFRQPDGRTFTALKAPISIEQTRYRYLLKR